MNKRPSIFLAWGVLGIGLGSLSPGLTAGNAAAQVNKRLSIMPVSLPVAMLKTPYSAALAAGDGKPPYRWSISSGKLPPGLSLAAGGAISGTPTAKGNFAFTVRVQDAGRPAQTATKAMTMTVNPAPVAKRLSITTAALPALAAGANYSAALAAGDGKPPYRWSISSGKLPPGLSLAAGGAIGGTPTTQGNSTFTVRVQDAGRPAQTATRALSIRIDPPLDRTASIPYKTTVWMARLVRGKLEVQGAGQGKWGRKWTSVGTDVYAFQGVGTSQGPVLIYGSGNRWHVTQLHWASGAPQNRRSFDQRVLVVRGGEFGAILRVGQICYDYSWNALKQIDCQTGRLIRVIR